ncbi:hypothetical protein WJX72_011994 [[Myrmecia] bisecta]|uniref:RecA family profile 1 domain-containing protein n=1 Tax=[Myrmecia] bisecta TaxID=41462 RepID=A0AAW1PDT3_9CHLO
MAARALQRMQLQPAVLQRLSERNITTARDLLLSTHIDLVEVLDLNPDEVERLVQHVSSTIIPQPVTVLDLHRSSMSQASHLATHLQDLDHVLKGGIPCGGITELVGPGGVGKTQLCLMLSVSALLASAASAAPPSNSQPGTVLYIDTEKKFSTSRLVEIAQRRWPADFASQAAVQALTQRLLVITPTSSADLLARLMALESTIIDHSVRLIVIDSIAAFARSEFDRAQIAERQQTLGQQAAALKYLAEAFRIPVLVTNQVTTRIQGPAGYAFDATSSSHAPETSGQSHLTAALGTMWAHAVNTRLVLETAGGARFTKIAKCPSAPNAVFAYAVTASGLELQPDVPVPVILQGSCVDMAIANEIEFEPEMVADIHIISEAPKASEFRSTHRAQPSHQCEHLLQQGASSDVYLQRERMAMAVRLGYDCVAVAHQAKDRLTEQDRCSIEPFDEAALAAAAQAFSTNSPILASYDILAVQPLSERVMHQACTSLDVDIIALDMSRRMPFKFRPATIKAALSRGIHFEICYSTALRDDSARRNLFSHVAGLVRATRGQGIVVSSGARAAFDLRGPYDVLNLATLFGLHEGHAKAALTSRCQAVVEHARLRKAYKGAIRIDRVPLAAAGSEPGYMMVGASLSLCIDHTPGRK